MTQAAESMEWSGARFARRVFVASVVAGVIVGCLAWFALEQDVEGLSRQLQRMPPLLAAHVQLTILALSVATVISVPLGVAAMRSEPLRHFAVGAAGVIQTIPGLALLAIMVPVLSGIGLPGIGFLPAFIGLTLYCVLPILMGTVTGLTEVDAAMSEAARGVGMTPAQRLYRVEFPLALPVIVSGLRTATVWCVGMATLSTPVGAASLGDYIFGGLQTRNYQAVLVGCVAAGVLAQVLDRVVATLEVGARTRSRWRVMVALTVLAVLSVGSFGQEAIGVFHDDQRSVSIGSKPFTEQYILAEITGQYLERSADVAIDRRPSLGSTVAFDALRSGDIDLYVEYTGTLWATILHRPTVPDRASVLNEIRRVLAEEYGIQLVASLGFENTYTLAIGRGQAEALGLRTFSDLARVSSDLVIGGDYEFFQRQEWAALRDVYSMSFRAERSMDPALMYQAIASQTVDVIGAYSTDGRLDAFGLRVLVDDRTAIPPYDALLLASPDFARERPDLVTALGALEGALDGGTMRRLNGRVDRDGASPAEVAQQFLEGL